MEGIYFDELAQLWSPYLESEEGNNNIIIHYSLIIIRVDGSGE